jgi:hypothetical protein
MCRSVQRLWAGAIWAHDLGSSPQGGCLKAVEPTAPATEGVSPLHARSHQARALKLPLAYCASRPRTVATIRSAVS